MKSIVGLFEQRASAEAAATKLRGAGIPADKITIQDQSTSRDHLVEASPAATTRRITRFFAILGGLVFALFGAAAAVETVRVVGAAGGSGNSTAVAITVFVVFVLIGLFCGVVIGAIKGAADADQELQHVRDGFQRGDTMVIVQADGDMARQAAAAMKSENAVTVMTSTHTQPMKLPPTLEELAAAPAAAH